MKNAFTLPSLRIGRKQVISEGSEGSEGIFEKTWEAENESKIVFELPKSQMA